MFDQNWAADDATLRILLGLSLESKGTVLECGSGRSTVELARVLKGTGRRHIALEQDWTHWGDTLQALLWADLTANVTLSPLVDGWYTLPELNDGEIGLLFVDGPAGGANRGQALEKLGRYLAPDAVIVVDDANRAAEIIMLEQWQRLGWTVDRRLTPRGCAVLRRATQEKTEAQ